MASSTLTLAPELLLQRLRMVAQLNAQEVELVMSLGQKPRRHAAGSLICPKSDGSPLPRLIVSGWASRPRILADGRCQVLSLQLPGDLIGDRGKRRPLAMTPSVALTPMTTVSAEPLVDRLARDPEPYVNLISALNSVDRIEDSQLLDHIVRLGCQSAPERLAHCLLELRHRLSLIGFTQRDTFPMPLTQETLGDALGLSLVHVNRTLSQLKRNNILRIRSGVVMILDAEKLESIADFSPPDYSSARNLVPLRTSAFSQERRPAAHVAAV